MGWCIGILLLIVGFVLFMIPGSQTIGWILWMAGIVCFGGQGFINYRKSSNPTEGMAASSLRKDEDHTENAEGISKEVDNKWMTKRMWPGSAANAEIRYLLMMYSVDSAEQK